MTEGAGYIGSHTAVKLLNADHEVVTVDNLCKSNVEAVRCVEALTGKAKNPYARSKQMMEMVLRDVQASDPTWRVCVLRYFNPIGTHKSGLIGEDPRDVPNNLLPYVAQVAVGRRPHERVFGGDADTWRWQ